MENILKQFNENYVFRIKGVLKDTYYESYENGEGEYNGGFDIDYLNKSFTINKDQFTKEYLTNLIVDHLKENLCSNLIEKDWLYISNNYLTLSTYEIDSDYSTEIITNIKEQEENDNQVYSCLYKFNLYINGQKLTEENMIKLLDFQN